MTDSDIQSAMFTQENINLLDKELDIPIYKGWFSVDYYLFGKFYEAKAYTDKSKKIILGVDINNRLTCLEFILFPIFLPIRFFLMNIGIIGKKREIIIEPIIK